MECGLIEVSNLEIGEIMNLLTQFAQSGSNCTLNGQPVDCSELADKAAPFLGLGIGLFVLFIVIAGIIAIATFVFWILMLLHAIKHQSPDRTIWIAGLIIAFLTGFMFIGALLYFFIEKGNAERATANGDQRIQSPSQ